MSISRRQFFRGLVGQSEDREREYLKRAQAVESYVRTNLLPYDFALTGEQTAEVLAAAVAGIDVEGAPEVLTYEHRTRLREIAEAMIERWREEHFRAEEARREALCFVSEFLSTEATPENLQNLKERFHVPESTALDTEIERQTRVWLGNLADVRLAACGPTELRELVLSELRSWC